MTISNTTEAQRAAAQIASVKNYEEKKNCPNRNGWTLGKCPVTEYRAKVNELGLANAIYYPWTRLCLYSDHKADYSKADAGVVEFKAGNAYSEKDIAKGAEIILFGNPLAKKEVFYCKYDTCNIKIHQRLTGDVEVRGWCYVTDPYTLDKWGNRVPNELRSMDTFPAQDWSE